MAGTRLREAVMGYLYVIRYRVAGADMLILRFRHAARRPTGPEL